MDIAEKIIGAQASALHRNMPGAMIGSPVTVLIICLVLWGTAPLAHLLLWFAGVLLLGGYRLVLWQALRGDPLDMPATRHWLRRQEGAALLAGALWGVGWFWLFPDGDVPRQFLFVSAIVAVSVVGMFTYSMHYRSFIVFFVPHSLLAIIALAWRQSAFHLILAAGMVVLSAIMMRAGLTYYRMYVNSLELRFENDDLVAQLMVQKDAAEAASLAKSRFLAAASHDLRQPMHALNLYLGTLREIPLPAQARSLLMDARQCADAMNGLFTALLDISRLDASAVEPLVEAFALAPLLERIRVEFEPQAREKGLALRVASCPAWVSSDATLVDCILRNLVSNAVRHSERGRILIACRRRGQKLRVAVWDTGPGISAAQQKMIFEEFYQVGNSERDRSKGLGLGLAIVDRLVRLLALPLTLVSREGRGTMFAIDLPLAPAGETAPPLLPPAGDAGRLRGALVLWVDDEAAICNAARTLLECWGCVVVTAASGSEALALLAAGDRMPDALICDYRLRDGENGDAVIRALRIEFNEDIPALLVTGDTSPQRIRELHTSGLPVLHKPLREDELKTALVGMLSSVPVSR